MIALKTLLMIVGMVLITVAAGIPLHGLWMQISEVQPIGLTADRELPKN